MPDRKSAGQVVMEIDSDLVQTIQKCISFFKEFR